MIRFRSMMFAIMLILATATPASSLDIDQIRSHVDRGICPSDSREYTLLRAEEQGCPMISARAKARTAAKDYTAANAYWDQYKDCLKKVNDANDAIRDYNSLVRKCHASSQGSQPWTQTPSSPPRPRGDYGQAPTYSPPPAPAPPSYGSSTGSARSSGGSCPGGKSACYDRCDAKLSANPAGFDWRPCADACKRRCPRERVGQ